MEGFIWFHKTIQTGTKSEYQLYREKHTDTELILKMFISSMTELQTAAESLDRSNILKEIKGQS